MLVGGVFNKSALPLIPIGDRHRHQRQPRVSGARRENDGASK